MLIDFQRIMFAGRSVPRSRTCPTCPAWAPGPRAGSRRRSRSPACKPRMKTTKKWKPNQTHRRLLKQNQKRISMKAKNPDFSEQYTYDQWRRVPSSQTLSFWPASEEFYYEKNSTKWVQISERINWCSIKMPRKNIEIVSQSSPLTKMAKIVIF